MAKMKWHDWLAITLLVAGGLNWGLWGVFDFNLVHYLFKWAPYAVERVVYIAVGVAAIYSPVRLAIK